MGRNKVKGGYYKHKKPNKHAKILHGRWATSNRHHKAKGTFAEFVKQSQTSLSIQPRKLPTVRKKQNPKRGEKEEMISQQQL